MSRKDLILQDSYKTKLNQRCLKVKVSKNDGIFNGHLFLYSYLIKKTCTSSIKKIACGDTKFAKNTWYITEHY